MQETSSSLLQKRAIFLSLFHCHSGSDWFSRLNFFLRQQFFCCLCVNANTYIENALPPVEMMRKQQVNITIGTDSLASNWGLSILDELKRIRQHFSSVPISELLQWATINGAKALQLQQSLGSFEKGKRPGVVLIEGLKDGNIAEASTAKPVL